MRLIPLLMLLPLAAALVPQTPTPRIERLDPALDKLIAPTPRSKPLAEGYDWSEGPVWVKEDGGYLLFSDVPQNVVYKWKEGAGAAIPLKPSGYTEPSRAAANGFERPDARRQRPPRPLSARRSPRRADGGAALRPAAKFSTLADRYDGKRFNSPNDVVFHSNGDMYFTDPPQGCPSSSRIPGARFRFKASSVADATAPSRF